MATRLQDTFLGHCRARSASPDPGPAPLHKMLTTRHSDIVRRHYGPTAMPSDANRSAIVDTALWGFALS
jgi:hypothetical protein